MDQIDYVLDALGPDALSHLAGQLGVSEDYAPAQLRELFASDPQVGDSVVRVVQDSGSLDSQGLADAVYDVMSPALQRPTLSESESGSEPFGSGYDGSGYDGSGYDGSGYDGSGFAGSGDDAVSASEDGTGSASETGPAMDTARDVVPAVDEFISDGSGFAAMMASIQAELADAIRAEYPQAPSDEQRRAIAEELTEAFAEALASMVGDSAEWNAALDQLAGGR